MLVKELMSPAVEWIDPALTLLDVSRKMRDKDIGCLPVGENDRLIGMITDRDIACRGVAEGCDPATTSVRDIMTKGITFCFETEDITEAARKMETQHVRRLAVLNADKRMVGLLSLADLSTQFHELTGEVLDIVSPHHH